LSAPKLGPIVRSSIISIGAESEPALSNNDKLRAALPLSIPVIWKRDENVVYLDW
jgi:hypothetical protein